MVDFGRQGRHSDGHFTGTPPLPPPFSISQNPSKDQALANLPSVAALNFNELGSQPKLAKILFHEKTSAVLYYYDFWNLK